MNRLTPIRIFVDSDVIISSLLSSSGAAYMLLNETKATRLYLSNFSIAELEPVTARLHIKPDKLSLLIAGAPDAPRNRPAVRSNPKTIRRLRAGLARCPHCRRSQAGRRRFPGVL